jgi:single-strand DNA-binding protein
MNKVILMGRMTRDPEIRYSQGENATAIARFSLAVDRRIKREGEPTADFISCVAFGKTAEVVEKHCKQGTKLVIEGRWQTGNYTNKDNVKVYTNDCMVESLEFAEKKASSEGDNSSPAPQSNEWMNVPDGVTDEGLPFN